MAAKKSEQALVGEWREMLSLHARTVGELDRALDRHGLGASDFEVLDILAEAAAGDDGGCLRVQEIASRVHLSQSALSRLVARLERDGLVRRAMCSEDRRGVRVELTDAGRSRHAEARPLRRAVLSRMLDPGED
ncbi:MULTISPECIES: MarR family transcriptional regulator [Streptomyces]|uniref:MarR family transcriptional regulator n=1 Tax=Streptomyces glycanivorans TaxID=3033808 RepID=A0ABY9JMI4_9ACTN|nr:MULTISPECIES: MarR family transcriptional regulator [unclassified Streptomyces]WSQ81549.1 MarR family transcriptional regulator [Streptomyces sp. NBC_01213]TXS10733.1 MarR family transcriptional regulator [Streptomyces sp. wa22]WLQ68194.1 MarR family transcriptional regulator [Streptomyces sp. Alt3]WSQ88876.1 MarR family transcriptional regulator [Streptomyces sp. NBC_01212]WSR52271.1 MarR family transcriptional regulator [Streptomyces sp. NBC_01201]